MFKIAIVGQGGLQTMKMLESLYKKMGLDIFTKKISNESDEENFLKEIKTVTASTVIIWVNYGILTKKLFRYFKIDVLIYLKSVKDTEAEEFFKHFKQKDVIIINGDDKQVFNLIKENKAQVITYGFNSKASLTASSVSPGNAILCCIQRTLPTFSGQRIEPQEFLVKFDNSAHKNIYNMMAAITAALVNGIDTGKFIS